MKADEGAQRIFNRRKNRNVAEPVPEQEDAPELPRQGPWDYSQRPLDDDDPRLINLGALILVGHPDVKIQLSADSKSEKIRSAVLFSDETGLDLRVFAAPRSKGLWADVRTEIIAEVQTENGQYTQREGPWGPELIATVPVTTPGGEDKVQPSRIIGIDGPRWFLRATILGKQAVQLTDEGLLMDALRDVVVNRGDEPRMVREQLDLIVPESATPTETSGPSNDGFSNNV